jgi:hypothetical protein
MLKKIFSFAVKKINRKFALVFLPDFGAASAPNV